MFDNNFLIVYLIFYTTIYNLSLYILFSVIIFTIDYIKTFNNINKINSIFSFRIWLSIILFSIAGVPPFLGFFNKLILIYFISNVSFFILSTFSILLLLSLYFYLQNIRYIMWLDNDSIKIVNTGYKLFNLNIICINLIILFFVCFGYLFIDDFILFINFIVS